MLYPVGIKAEDFQKPLIGVADLHKLDIVSVFDAAGEHAKKIGDAELPAIGMVALPEQHRASGGPLRN
jgi:hypothetical protein